MGDEVNGGFGAGFGGRVEVGAVEGLEVGLCEGLNVFDVAVDWEILLVLELIILESCQKNLPRSKSKASEET